MSAPARPFRLRILHFNDLHGRLAGVDVGGSTRVFSRIAGAIARAREECAHDPSTGLLVLAAGDDLVGSPFAELQGCRPTEFRCHPAYRLYSAAGLDAAVIGNHDLDWGLDLLVASARQDASFPLLSANLVPTGPLPSEIRPSAVFERGGLQIGVIGLTTPGEIKHLEPGEFSILHPVEAIRALVSSLRADCDVVIVLSHLGHSLDNPYAIAADAGDVELAAALPFGAVDLIIGGHTHTVLNLAGLEPRNVINGTVIAQAGANGEYLGDVVIELPGKRRDGGAARVVDARLHPIAQLAPDEAFEAAHIAPLVAQVQPLLAQPLGAVTPHPDLNALRVRRSFASEESALANFVADALVARCRAAGLPVDFGIVDQSSLSDGLPQIGVLTFGDIFRLAPFADSIIVLSLPAGQLQALLDDNARRASLREEECEERGFVQFSREVRYTCAPAQDAAGRQSQVGLAAYSITVNGVLLNHAIASGRGTFRIAASSFLRQLCRRWERGQGEPALFDLCGLPVEQTGLSLREALVAHVLESGGVTASGGLIRDGRVRFLSTASAQPGKS
jgi:5'-nucleotidase / UDP-sugar diphosphatase